MKERLQRTGYILKETITMNFREVECEYVDITEHVQNTVMHLVIVKIELNMQVS
jgi:hypothetical protein